MFCYPHLFEPLQVKKLHFRNRIWCAPTAQAMAFLTPEGYLRPEGIEHFRNRAHGGAAVVTLGESVVDREHAVGHYHSLNLQSVHTLAPLTTLTDAIHQAGAMASVELSHAGRWALPQCCEGRNPIAPSAWKLDNGVQVDAMTEAQMDKVADNFAETCAFLRNAGFRMCVIHGGHTWLLGQFLSPLENFRTDKFGGSLENRARFPLMVLERIRARVGSDFVIEYRLSGTEGHEGGFDLPEAIEFVKMIEDKIDLIHISRGSRAILRTRPEMHPSTFMPHGANVFLAEAVKKSGVRIPVIAVGNISDPDKAEQILAEGKADIVAMARAVIADPDWADKARHGKKEDIRPCIKCFNCLDEKNARVFGGGITSFAPVALKRYACSTNPRIGIEHDVILPPVGAPRRVVVVGGGPAGMQAAITAAERGHHVVLYEQDKVLGGQLLFADHVAFKWPLRDFKDYLVHRVKALNVDVVMGTAATPELVAAQAPDALIVAIGSVPVHPDLPGIDAPQVLTAARACTNPELVGARTVVIGGGDTGCETALHLAAAGRAVTIVEMDEFIARRTGYTHRIALVERVESQTCVRTGTRCLSIRPDGVEVVDAAGTVSLVAADSVVLALGSRPRLAESDAWRQVAPIFRAVGDCIDASNVRHAVRTGYDAVCRL